MLPDQVLFSLSLFAAVTITILGSVVTSSSHSTFVLSRMHVCHDTHTRARAERPKSTERITHAHTHKKSTQTTTTKKKRCTHRSMQRALSAPEHTKCVVRADDFGSIHMSAVYACSCHASNPFTQFACCCLLACRLLSIIYLNKSLGVEQQQATV